MKLFFLPVLALVSMGATQCNFNDVVVRACNGLDDAYEYYDEIAASGALSMTVQYNVGVFRTQSDRACANPSSVTPAQMAGIAAGAYKALKAAYQQGQGQGDADEAATRGLEKIEDIRAMLERYRK